MHDICSPSYCWYKIKIFSYNQSCTEIICWIHEPPHVLDYSTPHARSVAAMVRFRIASLSQRYLRRATLGGSGTTNIPMKSNSTTSKLRSRVATSRLGAARCRQGQVANRACPRSSAITPLRPSPLCENRLDGLHRELRRCCADISHNAPPSPYRVG